MPEFDIDSFKNTWQQQEVKPKYDTGEILSMLNQKSRNYVKYILWISIAEFLVFLVMNVYYISHNDDSAEFFNVLARLGITKSTELESNFAHLYMGLKIVSLLVTAFFVVKFFINYKKIHVESNLKKFILQIMRFKRTVNHFILANIALLLLFMVIMMGFTFKVLSAQNIHMDHPTLIGFMIGSTLMILLMIGLIILYYRVVYGIILNRLGRNLKQLQEMDSEN